MNRRHPHTSPRLVMWTAIAGSVALLGLLLALGWADRAWTTAAGVLLLSCLFICIWAATAAGRTTEREVSRAIDRLAAARQQEQRRTSRNGPAARR